MTRRIKQTGLFFSLFLTASCLKGPSFMRDANKGVESNQRGRSENPSSKPTSIQNSQVSGTTVAKVTSSSTSSQEIVVPPESGVSGTTITFPPGSLAVDTEIKIQEAAPVATNWATAELGIPATLTAAGKSVAVQPSVPADPAQPFTVSLALPSASLSNSELSLQQANLIVLYRVQSFAEGRTIIGVVPLSDLTVANSMISFTSRYFGAFQAAYSSAPVVKAQSATSSTPVQTKQEIVNLPSLKVTGRTPMVATSGSRVEISGQNFRPTLVVAVSGKKAGDLQVLSDSRASFVVPNDASFGLTSMGVFQDGVSETISIFYKGDKADFPISTEGAENICEGRKFYDQSGSLKVGTKPCKDYPPCTKDGQLDCVATLSFVAAATSGLASKILSGSTVGGIDGSYTLPADCVKDGQTSCLATSAFAAAATTSLASKVLAGQTVAGIAGAYALPALCTAAGQTGCLTTATYKSMDLSQVGANGAAGITATNFNTKVASAGNFEFWDASGARHIKAGDTNLLATNIKSGVSLFGLSGSVTPSPSNCTSAAQTGCVTTSTYKSMDLSQVGASSATGLTAANFDTKLTSAANFEFWDASGARHIKAGDVDLTTINVKDAVVVFGVTGTLTGTPANCSTNGQQNCLATSTFYAATACAANGADTCYLNPGAVYDAADWTNLTAANIKNGASVAGLTGTYPSSGNLLVGADATADLDSSTFNTKIKSATAFEFFGPDGTRYTGAGDADITAAKILSGQDIFGAVGSVTASPANCSSNGSQSCVATGTYFAATACAANGANCFVPTYAATTQPLKAISYDAIDAGKASIRSSLTLAGISGTLANCSTNNAAGCVTTAPYNSADWTNLTAANIKSGASVAGLTGTYPSAGNLLTGADATADLDTATFDARIKSASSFEFFGPDGTRYMNIGDPDITSSNIASGVTIFGATGTAYVLTQCTSGVQATCESDTACRWHTGACEINPWHIRAGVTVASKAGSLKSNCRNTINNSYFNWDGSVASLPTSAQTGGTAYDIWDTIDDSYGYPANKVTAWSSNTQCDSTNWTDVTTTNGGISLTTCGTSSTCIYRDELSGLRVTGILSSGSNTTNTGTPALYTWSAAINACNGSTYGGYGAGTWRLPTQKELMSLYEHGIVSRVGASFHTLGNLQNYYWSSSSNSSGTAAGWLVSLSTGYTNSNTKTNSFYALCVF